MKKNIVIIALSIFVVVLAGTSFYFFKDNIKNDNQILSTCKKEEGCCMEDSDCYYTGYTGGCFTPEYVRKMIEEYKGSIQSANKWDEELSCVCRNNKCQAK